MCLQNNAYGVGHLLYTTDKCSWSWWHRVKLVLWCCIKSRFECVDRDVERDELLDLYGKRHQPCRGMNICEKWYKQTHEIMLVKVYIYKWASIFYAYPLYHLLWYAFILMYAVWWSISSFIIVVRLSNLIDDHTHYSLRHIQIFVYANRWILAVKAFAAIHAYCDLLNGKRSKGVAKTAWDFYNTSRCELLKVM